MFAEESDRESEKVLRPLVVVGRQVACTSDKPVFRGAAWCTKVSLPARVCFAQPARPEFEWETVAFRGA
jgi:hypothetical protein